ncbi:MAG: cupin domain-containing protein [Chloroflexi bacterium]|nr:cupin domain-containing protein [Chloroflexota bacterium]
MAFEEALHWGKGSKTADFYQAAIKEARDVMARDERLVKVVHPEDQPWEKTRSGRIKWLVHEKMGVRVRTLDLCIEELPPGARSVRHRHSSEEFVFTLEGQGHDLHWDMEAHTNATCTWTVASAPTRWDWAEGDVVFIPVNTVHQHVNNDPQRPARLLCATNRVYSFLGFPEIAELPDASDAAVAPQALSAQAPTVVDIPGINAAGWAGQMVELDKLKGLPRLLKFKDFHVNSFGTRGITTSGASAYPDDNVPMSVFKCWLAFVNPEKGDEQTRGHSHQFEAVFYILDGAGYEIHDGIRYPWTAGDAVVVHTGCVHAHFADPGTTARALVITAKPLYCRTNLKQEQTRPGARGH